ncbi:MAG: aldo/keto reductase, partial [Pseudomonadota bacterium]
RTDPFLASPMAVIARRIGAVIRERHGLPEGFIVSSKLDRDNETGVFDAAQARRSLEQSLKALGVDRIPLLHLHDPEHARSVDEIAGVGGALPELMKMKEEGLTDAIGLAAGRTDIMMPLMRNWDFDAIITHNRFTVVNRHAEEMIDLAVARRMAVLNAAPYSGGVLAKGAGAYGRYVYQEATEEMLAPVKAVEAVCTKHNVPMGAVALQFSMRDARITSTICGVSKPERVQETLVWAETPIPEVVWAELSGLAYSGEDPEATRRYTLG